MHVRVISVLSLLVTEGKVDSAVEYGRLTCCIQLSEAKVNPSLDVFCLNS